MRSAFHPHFGISNRADCMLHEIFFILSQMPVSIHDARRRRENRFPSPLFRADPMYILLQNAENVVLSGISSIQPARGRRVPYSAKRVSARTSAVHFAVNKASAESLTRKGAFDHMEHGKL